MKKYKSRLAMVLVIVMAISMLAVGTPKARAEDVYETAITGAALYLRYDNKSYSQDFFNLKLGDTRDYFVWDGAQWPGGVVKEDKTLPANAVFQIPEWSVGNTAIVKFGADMGNNKETYMKASEGYVQLVPVSEGKTTLSWTVGTLKKEVTVYVRRALATGMTLKSSPTVTLSGKGKTSQIDAVVNPSTASQDIKYSSDNPAVATVSDKGVITAVSKGTTQIRVMPLGGNGLGYKTITVTVGDDKGEEDKKEQTITTGADIYNKTYGNKAFSLKAETDGGGKLTYKSSSPKVATVNSAGLVTIKGTGKAVITITAAATKEYKEASKEITVTVKPKKASLKKLTAKKAALTVKWVKDGKASGYEILLATNSRFTKNKKKVIVKSYKKTSTTVKRLKSKKLYYVKIRSYKLVNGKKIYGAYSKVKKLKTK